MPPYIRRLGFAPGEWSAIPKLPIRALMRPTWPLRVRVWGALVVHTFGFEGELAVFQRESKRKGGLPVIKPAMLHELRRELNESAAAAYKESKVRATVECLRSQMVSRQDLRRALAAMEDEDGLIVRVRQNRSGDPPPKGEKDTRPLCNLVGLTLDQAISANAVTPLANLSGRALKRVGQKVCLYLLARPRPARNLDVGTNAYVGDRKAPGINGDSPNIRPTPEQLILSFLAPQDKSAAPAILSDPEVLAAIDALRDAIDRAVASHHGVATPSATVPVSVSPEADGKGTANATPPHRGAALSAPIAQSRPAIPQTAISSSEPAAPRPPVSAAVNPKRSNTHPPRRCPERVPSTAVESPGLDLVQQAMQCYSPFPVEMSLAISLFSDCRRAAPSCRVETVVRAVHLKGALTRDYDHSRRDVGPNLRRYPNPPAFLRVAVPKLFAGEYWKRIEAEVLNAERAAQEEDIARARLIVASPEHSWITEEDREWARQTLDAEEQRSNHASN
jgi:hypothetical protein